MKELSKKDIKIYSLVLTICLALSVMEGCLLLIMPDSLTIYRLIGSILIIITVMTIEPERKNRLLYTFSLLLCVLCIIIYVKSSIGYVSQFWTYFCICLTIRGKSILLEKRRNLSVVKNGNF